MRMHQDVYLELVCESRSQVCECVASGSARVLTEALLFSCARRRLSVKSKCILCMGLCPFLFTFAH